MRTITEEYLDSLRQEAALQTRLLSEIRGLLEDIAVALAQPKPEDDDAPSPEHDA